MKYNYVRKKHKPATLTRSNSSRGGLRGAYNDAASNNDYRENKFSAAAGRPMAGGGLSIGCDGTVGRFNEPVKQPRSLRVRSYQGRGPPVSSNVQLNGIMTGQPIHKMKHQLIKRFNLDSQDRLAGAEPQGLGLKGARKNRNSINGRIQPNLPQKGTLGQAARKVSRER